jgi:putative hydrolase of the HAD superfamily
MAALRIKNVIFDFGGVLINWRPQDVVAELFNEPEVQDAVMRSVFLHPDWLELDRGTLHEDEAAARFSARSGVSSELIGEMLERLRDSLNLLPDTALLVQSLVEHGIPVYGLSNMSVQTFELLQKRHEIWPLFRGIVISGAVGMVKPEHAIFEHIASEYGLVPAETVLVDDQAANILTADDLGFQTILFRDFTECARRLRQGLGLETH